MQSLFPFALVVFVAVSGAAAGDDGCPSEVLNGNSCCNLKGILTIYHTHRTYMQECEMKYNISATRQRSPFKVENTEARFLECLMLKMGLMTADNRMNTTLITDFFSPSETVWEQVVQNALDKCFCSTLTGDDSNSKRGAGKFFKCFHREIFLNCPAPLWSVTPKCDELKANITRCPETQVKIMQYW